MEIQRDGQGKVQTIRTSWGDQQTTRTIPKTGELKTAELSRGSSKAVIEFAQGRLRMCASSDGGAVTVSYYDLGGLTGLLKKCSRPNDLVLTYEYDSDNRLAAVTVA